MVTPLQKRRRIKRRRDTKRIRKSRTAEIDALIPPQGKTPEKKRKNKKRIENTNQSQEAEKEAEKENKNINKIDRPKKIHLNRLLLSLRLNKWTNSNELRK
jgi:hypothetical protein